jgi:hypothetical protein
MLILPNGNDGCYSASTRFVKLREYQDSVSVPQALNPNYTRGAFVSNMFLHEWKIIRPRLKPSEMESVGLLFHNTNILSELCSISSSASRSSSGWGFSSDYSA